MNRRPAFTLLEVMLASALGAIVVITCLGVFAAIDRADRRSRDRFERTLELSTTQRAIERTLRNLIMSPSPPGNVVPGAAGARPATPATPPAETTDAQPDAEPEVPRMILEVDLVHAGTMSHLDASGNEQTFPVQRLEIVVQSAPVFAEPLGSGSVEPMSFNARPTREQPKPHRRRRDHRAHGADARDATNPDQQRDPANQSDQSDQTADEDQPTALAPGIRGVFELSFDPPGSIPARRTPPPSTGLGGVAPTPEDHGSWSLWWRPLPLMSASADADAPVSPLSPPDPSNDPLATGSTDKHTGPVRLASGLECCRWEMVRDDQVVDRLEANRWEELPAYITLEIKTTLGHWHKWMFEVGAARGPEPGTPLDANGEALQDGLLRNGVIERLNPDRPHDRLTPPSQRPPARPGVRPMGTSTRPQNTGGRR